MDIPRELREELNALSKDVFGVQSKWQKMLKNGTLQVVTVKVTEKVPGVDGKEDTTREVDVPVKPKQTVLKRYSIEEIHSTLLDYKKQIDAIRETVNRQKEEQKRKQEEEKAIQVIKEAAQGSAV